MRHTALLGQQPDAWARLRVSMVEIELPDKLIDLIGEDVFAPALVFGAAPVAIGADCCRTSGTKFLFRCSFHGFLSRGSSGDGAIAESSSWTSR